MTRNRLTLLVCTACLLLAAGCTGAKAPLPAAQDLGQPANSQVATGQPAAAPFNLPLPLDLARLQQAQAKTRQASDFNFWGYSFEELLPHNRAEAVFLTAEFTPDYTAGGPLAGAAYAIYSLELENNDVALKLEADTFTQQGNLADLWIGFGNLDRNRWDWFQLDALPGKVAPPDQPGYKPAPPATQIYMALVFTGHDTWVLDHGTFGNDAPAFNLYADATSGTAPLAVEFTADIFDASDVVSIEWDLDGDGAFEFSGTLADTVQNTTFTSAGLYDVAARVTDDLGAATIETLPIAVNEHRTRTWGTSATETGTGVAVDDAGNLYVCGHIQGDQAVLLKFNPQMELVWSKVWDNGYIETYEDVVCIGNDIYVTGKLVDNSVAPSDDQILLHRYDSAGNLVLQKVYGDPDDDDEPFDLATDGTTLYLGGYTWDDVDDTPQLLVAKFLNNLAVVWGKVDRVLGADFTFNCAVAVAPWDDDKLLVGAGISNDFGSVPAGLLNLNAGDGTVIWQRGLLNTDDTGRKFNTAAVAGGPSGPCLIAVESGPCLIQFDAAGNIVRDDLFADDTFCAKGALVQDAAGNLRWAGGNTYDAMVYSLVPGATQAATETLFYSGTFYGRGYDMTAATAGAFFVTGYADFADGTTWKRDTTSGPEYEDVALTASDPGFAFSDWVPNMGDTSAAPADIIGVLDAGGDADSGSYDVLVSKFVPAE